MADACVFLMEKFSFNDLLKIKDNAYPVEIVNTHVNIGSGDEISIRELALLIQKVIGFEGSISFDHSKPDGTTRKLLDISRLTALGWKRKVRLEEGIRQSYEVYDK